MNPVKLIRFLILLIINFILVTVINYVFLKWLGNKPDTTISSVLLKSAIMAIVLTFLFILFNKKKNKDNE